MPNLAEHEFIMLINVKMPTIVGILTFISMINAISDSLKARIVFILQEFCFYEKLNFHAQLSRNFHTGLNSKHEKSFIT